MASFGDLYEYNVNGGVVSPQTSTIKQSVETAFKQIFGDDFSTDETTANGRLIETITMMFVDVCGVNAQNAKSMNIEQAVGLFLDNLGMMFNVERDDDESDYAYRKRILDSYSRGSGFASSIKNAISLVDDVTKVVVLENGFEDPAIRPLNEAGESEQHSIAIKPHSVFISVLGGSDVKIAEAIRNSKSAGCGFEDSENYGTVVSKQVDDGDNSFIAKFYRPSERYVNISATVSNASYTGTDIISDSISAIQDLIKSNSINSTITSAMILAALASSGKNIVGLSVSMKVRDSSDSTWESVSSIVIPAYKYLDETNTTENSISITIQ